MYNLISIIPSPAQRDGHVTHCSHRGVRRAWGESFLDLPRMLSERLSFSLCELSYVDTKAGAAAATLLARETPAWGFGWHRGALSARSRIQIELCVPVHLPTWSQLTSPFVVETCLRCSRKHFNWHDRVKQSWLGYLLRAHPEPLFDHCCAISQIYLAMGSVLS